MKKVLIMGANPETVSLILKAKAMGLHTIVTDYDPNAYAKQFADQAENVDAIDVNRLVKLAIREKVDGVLVGVAEALLPAYCEVCNRLNVPCYSSLEQFDVMVRKDNFKAKCKEYGVPTVKEYSLEKRKDITYPVIVKPVDSCSSKGISVCHNTYDLNSAVEKAKNYSKAGAYIVEEYMTGDEVISYYVIQEGTPIFVGMCDRYTCKPNKQLVQLPTCYIFPSKHIKSYVETTDSHVKDLIKGLGLKHGSLFLQCFVDKDGITRVYEPGYRLNGAQEHILISKLTGVDARELYINYALSGKDTNQDLESISNPMPDKYSCKLSPLIKTGMIGKIEGLEIIKKMKGVISINPSYREGDEVTGEGTLKQIVCRFFLITDTKEQLAELIDKIQDTLKVLDLNGNNMIVGTFDTSLIQKYY